MKLEKAITLLELTAQNGNHKTVNSHFSKPYVVSLPLRRSPKETNPDNGKNFDVELRIQANFKIRKQVLKYGSLIKVFKPKCQAEKIRY